LNHFTFPTAIAILHFHWCSNYNFNFRLAAHGLRAHERESMGLARNVEEPERAGQERIGVTIQGFWHAIKQ
jgi:hypothetical protein